MGVPRAGQCPLFTPGIGVRGGSWLGFLLPLPPRDTPRLHPTQPPGGPWLYWKAGTAGVRRVSADAVWVFPKSRAPGRPTPRPLPKDDFGTSEKFEWPVQVCAWGL